MENINHIENQLKEMDASGISCKRNSIITDALLAIAGIVLFLLGIRKITGSDSANMTLLIFGLGAFIYGVVKICLDVNSMHYYYTPTHQRLKKYQVYVNTNDRPTIKKMFQSHDFNNIGQLKREMSSGCMLYILVTDNGDCGAVQCQDLTMDMYEPTTDVVLLTGAEAKPLYDFAKGK